VVADHAEYMGTMRAINDGTAVLEKLGPIDSIKRWIAIYLLNRAIDDPVKGREFFDSVIAKPAKKHGVNPLEDPNYQPPGGREDSVFGDTTETETTA